VKGKAGKEFKGELIKRANVRKEEELPKQEKVQADEKENDDKIGDKETERELEIKSFKRNSNRLLHHRNIYVFLASVAEEAMSNTQIKSS
jgi:serine/threonine-protein kinase ULK/ATG1